jgi:hypothetical protein
MGDFAHTNAGGFAHTNIKHKVRRGQRNSASLLVLGLVVARSAAKPTC